MKQIKVGAAALNQTPLDWKGNRKRIVHAITRAQEQEVSLLCLPELAISGYGCEDHFHASYVYDYSFESLKEICRHTKGIALCVGLPVLFCNRAFNAVAVVADGRILGFVPKQFLAVDGVHYENRWFVPWTKGEVARLDDRYPIGDLLFDFKGVQIGIEVCRDAWSGGRPATHLAAAGADIILNPSASHFSFGKNKIRERFALEAARMFGVGYVFSNLLGCESGRTIFEGDCFIVGSGRILTRAPRLSLEPVTLVTGIIDLNETKSRQLPKTEIPPIFHGTCERVLDDFSLVRKGHNLPPSLEVRWEESTKIKYEEFSRAITLGLYDYLRKSKSKGCVVSLSGGADSAATALLVVYMVRRAMRELGHDRLVEAFSHVPELLTCTTEEQCTERLLTCVYQESENSTPQSRCAAESLAAEIGSAFYLWKIDGVVAAYRTLVEEATGRTLHWDTDDVALQNIQARARAPGAWLLANIRSFLLLTTGNRSELDVGYATMDGDTAGGLNIIGGIDKFFLRKWLIWIENAGPEGLGAFPSLKEVNALPPSAELRPRCQKQTDESDLMPYEILQAIELEAIYYKKEPTEAFESLKGKHGDRYGAQDLKRYVRSFYELWAKSQWKRERAAPSFHVDDLNVDPRSWCRFPILSAGFDEELRRLDLV
jgi:NAD+ synthase (glutamine-hydrolysing)